MDIYNSFLFAYTNNVISLNNVNAQDNSSFSPDIKKFPKGWILCCSRHIGFVEIRFHNAQTWPMILTGQYPRNVNYSSSLGKNILVFFFWIAVVSSLNGSVIHLYTHGCNTGDITSPNSIGCIRFRERLSTECMWVVGNTTKFILGEFNFSCVKWSSSKLCDHFHYKLMHKEKNALKDNEIILTLEVWFCVVMNSIFTTVKSEYLLSGMVVKFQF